MKKKIIVTTSWDDGHVLDLKLAKLLKKYKIRGTFYVSPKNNEFDKKDLLSEKEIKTLSKGFEIGAHTITHPHLPKISIKKAEEEIKNSKKYLSKITGKKINSFCYPYGEYNNAIKKIVEKSGFKLARTVVRSNAEIYDQFQLNTTTHAYTHIKDLTNIQMLISYKTIDWEKLAKKKFDKVFKNGGTFHLWGHSWEIEKFYGWKKLEKVLQHISNRKNVEYLTNSDLTK